jgi:hypothetical protein
VLIRCASSEAFQAGHERFFRRKEEVGGVIRAPNYDKTMNSVRVDQKLVWCPRYELNVRPAV